ncbi:UNVERIFIED_CONTAM: hypothetical protein FKN15_011063 [Acipenser sinensis]
MGRRRKTWEEPEHLAPEWKEPERPAPEWEEPECPVPEWPSREPEEVELPSREPEEVELPSREPEEVELPSREPEEVELPSREPEEVELPSREPEEVELPSREPEEVELPSREPEGEKPQTREPEGEKAEVPQQPLHMLLRGAQGRHTRLRRQKVPAQLQRPLEWPQPPPPIPECLEPWPLEELELPLPEWPPSPSVVPEGLSAVPEGSSSPPVVPECLPAVLSSAAFRLNPTLRNLLQSAQNYMSTALAPSSRASYSTAWAVKWFDNHPVTLLSTYAAANPSSTVERWDKRRKEAVQVIRPNIVKLYNQNMGGVDLLDSLIALYQTKIRSKKWYHHIVFHMMDFTLVQAWLLYRGDCRDCGIQKKEQLSLLEFKTEVASCLCKQNKINLKRKGRPSHCVETRLDEKRQRWRVGPVPPTPVRQDNTDHWPVWAETRAPEPRRLAFRTQAALPRLQPFPVFPDFLEEVRSSWNHPALAPSVVKWAAPLASRVLGLAEFPPVDLTITALVQGPPVGGVPKDPACPNGQWKSATLPEPVASELRLILSMLLLISDFQRQALGRSLASLVVAHRQFWLTQARVPDEDKSALLDMRISPCHTFGPAVEETLQRTHQEHESSRQIASMLPSSTLSGYE